MLALAADDQRQRAVALPLPRALRQSAAGSIPLALMMSIFDAVLVAVAAAVEFHIQSPRLLK